jgi:hypothetical protein
VTWAVEHTSESGKLNILARLDELEAVLPLQSSEQTLGHAAVFYAHQHAAIVAEMGQYEIETDEYQRYSVYEESFRLKASRELGNVRLALVAMTSDNEGHLDQYLNMQTPLTHVSSMIDSAEKRENLKKASLGWKDWLTKYTTGDELLNFLQFHNYIIERQQKDPLVQEAMDAQKQKFIQATKDLREAGTLAGPVEKLDDIELRVGDIFDMTMKERVGYYNVGIDKIHVQQGYLRGPNKLVEEFLENIPHVATHELVHAALGESLKQLDSPLAARWINEAITEELTRAINRKMGPINEESTTYLNERALLQLLLSGGSGSYNAFAYKLATRGFSGSKADREEFEAYLDIIWGTTDVLGKLNQAIELEEANHTGTDAKSTRVGQRKALEAIYSRLKDTPDSIFVQYEEAIAELTKVAAKE